MSEIQAVVLAAGRGSRMTQLLGGAVTKCLLPVGGQPLIFYSLSFLVQNGFQNKDVLLLLPDVHEVRNTVVSLAESMGLSNFDTMAVPDDSEDFGTMESIRLAYNYKKLSPDQDLLIISCDLLINMSLMPLLNLRGTYDADFTTAFVKNVALGGHLPKLPGPKNKISPEKDIVGVKPTTNEIVFMASEGDLDDGLLTIPRGTLQKSIFFKIFSALTDTHLYLMSRRLVSFMVQEQFDDQLNIKGEFLPFILKKQFDDGATSDQKFRFYGVIDKTAECIRVNTISSFAIANKSMDWIKSTYTLPEDSHHQPKSRISKSSRLIATSLGENCIVGDNVKLVNVIGMDEIEIEDGANLENCIISSNVKIRSKCVLKECLIGPKFEVAAGNRFTNEYLTAMEETLFESDAE